LGKDCPSPPVGAESRPCNYCGIPGHLQRSCPDKLAEKVSLNVTVSFPATRGAVIAGKLGWIRFVWCEDRLRLVRCPPTPTAPASAETVEKSVTLPEIARPLAAMRPSEVEDPVDSAHSVKAIWPLIAMRPQAPGIPVKLLGNVTCAAAQTICVAIARLARQLARSVFRAASSAICPATARPRHPLLTLVVVVTCPPSSAILATTTATRGKASFLLL
jgi:hypothetical protein